MKKSQRILSEGNARIAEFMGFRKGSILQIPASFICKLSNQIDVETGLMVWEEDRVDFSEVLKFDRRWDWIMPVIKKISKIRIIHNEKYDLFDRMGEGFYEVDIMKVWKAVVEMIEWNNKQK